VNVPTRFVKVLLVKLVDLGIAAADLLVLSPRLLLASHPFQQPISQSHVDRLEDVRELSGSQSTCQQKVSGIPNRGGQLMVAFFVVFLDVGGSSRRRRRGTSRRIAGCKTSRTARNSS
jgi:hypothetical protein